jgi:hypothetical protein
MFTRIRYAAHVLSSPTTALQPHERPDIVFEDAKPQEVTAASKRIAKLIEILLISLLVSSVSVHFISAFFAQKNANLTGITATMAALLAIVLDHLRATINSKIGEKLKIGERISPYVGHRLARTYRIIRG